MKTKATPAMTDYFQAKKDLRAHDKQCPQCQKSVKSDSVVRCKKGEYLLDRMDHKQAECF